MKVKVYKLTLLLFVIWVQQAECMNAWNQLKAGFKEFGTTMASDLRSVFRDGHSSETASGESAYQAQQPTSKELLDNATYGIFESFLVQAQKNVSAFHSELVDGWNLVSGDSVPEDYDLYTYVDDTDYQMIIVYTPEFTLKQKVKLVFNEFTGLKRAGLYRTIMPAHFGTVLQKVSALETLLKEVMQAALKDDKEKQAAFLKLCNALLAGFQETEIQIAQRAGVCGYAVLDTTYQEQKVGVVKQQLEAHFETLEIALRGRAEADLRALEQLGEAEAALQEMRKEYKSLNIFFVQTVTAWIDIQTISLAQSLYFLCPEQDQDPQQAVQAYFDGICARFFANFKVLFDLNDPLAEQVQLYNQKFEQVAQRIAQLKKETDDLVAGIAGLTVAGDVVSSSLRRADDDGAAPQQ